MKLLPTLALTAFLATNLLAADPLYTQEGSDPSFEEVLKSDGVKVGNRFSKGPVLGSRIHVNHALLEKQVGPIESIPNDIGLHTQICGDSIRRKDFPNWTRWYQEDGNVQIFRLFAGEQNVRGGEAENGKPGRVEVFSRSTPVPAGTWNEWEGTYTMVKPIDACIFQVMHAGKSPDGSPLLWPVHLSMTSAGEFTVDHRRPGRGQQKSIVVAKDMVGKSLSFKVRANGKEYEVYQKPPLDKGPWKLVATGTYAEAEERKIQFRWGPYAGSKLGKAIPNDTLLLVTGVKIRVGVK